MILVKERKAEIDELLAAVRAGNAEPRQKLLDALRSGDVTVRHALIESNLPLCKKHVRALASGSASADARADAESECALALTAAVARIVEGQEVSNVDDYLDETVRATAERELGARSVELDGLVRVPNSTYRRRRDKGNEVAAPDVAQLDATLPAPYAPEVTHATTRETWEALLSVCRPGSCDEPLLRLLADGYNYREAAEKLNLTPSTVDNARRALRERYREKFQETEA